MPDITHTLQGNDLGFLKIVAERWGIELDAPDVYSALPVIVDALQNPNLVHEIIEALPEEARYALKLLLNNDGKILWAQFCRRFGELRSMGPAKRDRERPDIDPVSITEILWYHALIGKAFLNIPPELQEYAYIPDDMIENLPIMQSENALPLGRPASPGECQEIFPTDDFILDEACTLLAALRMKISLSDLNNYPWRVPIHILHHLLVSVGLIDKTNNPVPDATRHFLEAPRPQALLELAQKWMTSTTFNELRLIPGLIFEGEWWNDPLLSRQTILEMLKQLPPASWWNISSFIQSVQEKNPDFQRPAGDYDSWFIRQEDTDIYLRGFQSWEKVDGELLRFIISGPMYWLGLMDLAGPALGDSPAAFRPSSWAPFLWQGKVPPGSNEDSKFTTVTSGGLIRIPRTVARSFRYQVSRFCEWEGQKGDTFLYRLTPASLQRAKKQNLRISQLRLLLQKQVRGPLPPNLMKALDQWERQGTQARIHDITIVQVDSAEALEALKQTRSAHYIVKLLNPTTAEIRPEGIEAIRRALIESGFLAQIDR